MGTSPATKRELATVVLNLDSADEHDVHDFFRSILNLAQKGGWIKIFNRCLDPLGAYCNTPLRQQILLLTFKRLKNTLSPIASTHPGTGRRVGRQPVSRCQHYSRATVEEMQDRKMAKERFFINDPRVLYLLSLLNDITKTPDIVP